MTTGTAIPSADYQFFCSSHKLVCDVNDFFYYTSACVCIWVLAFYVAQNGIILRI